MTRAVLSLGSNMADRGAFLRGAVESLVGAGSVVHRVSSVYRTPPWGPVEQPDYYNLVLEASDPTATGQVWLDRCHAAEAAAGRERLVRWGPRTLDADVVAVWTENAPVTSEDERLMLPHPRAFERGFVLIPWAEIDPEAELPLHGPIADLIAALDPDEVSGIARVDALESV